VVVINKTEKESDMKVKYVCRECEDDPCEITLDDGDIPTHCVVAARECPWRRVETQPELMNGIQALFEVFKRGGGEIWFEAEGEIPDHRATISADFVVTKGTINGISELQKFYTVRPLPHVTFGLGEALGRRLRGEDVAFEIDGVRCNLRPIIRIEYGTGEKWMTFFELADKRFTVAT